MIKPHLKQILTACILCCCLPGFSQKDSGRIIEPGQETSFDNYELLIIAVLGLVILMGLRFWFKRTRKR